MSERKGANNNEILERLLDMDSDSDVSLSDSVIQVHALIAQVEAMKKR